MDKTRRMSAEEFRRRYVENGQLDPSVRQRRTAPLLGEPDPHSSAAPTPSPGGALEETARRNRRSNDRGKIFENLLMKGCQYYRERGIAVINKVYEPYICTKILSEGKFIGRFLDRAEPDFKGVLATGRAVAFEAKSTQKSRIQRNAVTPTQFEWLAEQEQMGALVFVAVNIKERFFRIPFKMWDNMQECYGKKFLMPEDIKEYEVIFDGSVRFLEFERDIFEDI
ncbi:MAG: Holliday junction resolvase RecU [Oscillospiraceae bacterium]|nr:Holliday junction resolvase RecU [Oscillospiraceae bacterium]